MILLFIANPIMTCRYTFERFLNFSVSSILNWVLKISIWGHSVRICWWRNHVWWDWILRLEDEICSWLYSTILNERVYKRNV